LSISRAIACTLCITLVAAVQAQGFDALEYFGTGFKADPGRPHGGVLSDNLTGDQPPWIEFSGSGEDLAADRFTPTKTGLLVRPDTEHGTCEAVIDAGLVRGTLQIEIVELAQGGAVAWHLRALDDNGAWLVELKHHARGGWQLRIRALSNGRYSILPDSKRDFDSLELPATLTLYAEKERLTGEIGGHKSEAQVGMHAGASAGLAVTDESARLKQLKLDLDFHTTWISAANTRLHARRALSRLREFATVGLLSGIADYRHPELAETLAELSDDETRRRGDALAADIYERASTLVAIANAHPGLAAARHEAGVAALIAGNLSVAHSMLTGADKLKPANVTSLALAETLRRRGELDAADRALQAAADGLPEDLRPDYALIRGRLLVGRGEVEAAERILREAGRQFPDHPQIDAFADSASVLFAPSMLRRATVPGPLGLTLMTDLSPAQFLPVLEELEPYIEKLRQWLPGLKDKLEGRIAIFSGPVDYLRAALLVAGDNLDNVAGMYLSHGIGGKPTVMACRAFGEDELRRTLVHELWHLALASTGADRAVPRWLNEGMAVYLSAGRVEGGVIRFDRLPSEFAGLDNIPPEREQFKRALSASGSEFYLPGTLRENYAAAWAAAAVFAGTPGMVQRLSAMLRGDEAELRAATGNLDKLHQAAVAAVTRMLKD
jgi:tetratricopeptide (TPR) repeat protein